MKIFDRIIALCVGLFLFFTFSNFNSLDDVVQSLKPDSDVPAELQENIKVEKAIVKDVIDGDTFKAEFSNGEIETIRLLLIDTPETVSPNVPEQPFGKEASDYLRKRLIKGTVVEIEKGVQERDKYNRLLAYVWRDGKNVNKELLEEGLARIAYVFEPNTKYLDEFKKAESKAKKERKGIWSIDGYVTERGFNYP